MQDKICIIKYSMFNMKHIQANYRKYSILNKKIQQLQQVRYGGAFNICKNLFEIILKNASDGTRIKSPTL